MADLGQANRGQDVDGTVAHDDVDGGNPIKVGFKAIAHGANPTAVAAADRTDWYSNRHGIPFVMGGHMNSICKEFTFTTAQTDAALVTVGSGTVIVVTAIEAVSDADAIVNVAVRVGFAASTLTAVSGSGITGIVLSHPDIAPGSGIALGNGGGIIGVGADGEDLRITCDAAAAGFRVRVTYFTIES